MIPLRLLRDIRFGIEFVRSPLVKGWVSVRLHGKAGETKSFEQALPLSSRRRFHVAVKFLIC